MESLARQEYPSMLQTLQPTAAVSTLNDRVKRVGKVNAEIADWLQERRKVEDLYVQGLKKLANKQPPGPQSELGIFTTPWHKIVSSVDSIAESHKRLSDRIEKDVEQALRSFTTKNESMLALTSVQGNLAVMAKELEDAKNQSEKLIKKGGKASAQKVEAATARLEAANTQWDTQAPFIYEALQALDETRLNHLRDVLTQLETHEADQVERSRQTAEKTLNSILEIDTAQEIQTFVQNSISGKPKLERTPRHPALRQSSSTAASSMPPPPTRGHDDGSSEHSGRMDGGTDSTLKSRIGTMIGRRRQSIHGGFQRATSPSKIFPFGSASRSTASRDGRPTLSPRASSNNLHEQGAHNRLSSLAESPTALSPASPGHNRDQANGTNGTGALVSDTALARSSSHTANGTGEVDVSDVQPPPGPPPSHLKAEGERDSEGFSVPAAMNDPISQAQFEAAEGGDGPGFKLDIKNEPIREEDTDAQAAVSHVTNALRSTAITPNRKVGTVRGRRDVRNTLYVPNELSVPGTDSNIPPSPSIAPARAQALAALSATGDHHAPPASDTTSIRSGHSLANHVSKHPDLHHPGLSSSIIESVTANFENGVAKDVKISGEIAFSYNAVDDVDSTSKDFEHIRINRFPIMEAIGPNRTFVHNISAENPDEFNVDLSHVTKSSVAFTYKRHIDEQISAKAALLLIKPAWKPQGDKLALALSYCLRPESGLTSVRFHNLVLVGIYQGIKASGCKTKPTGTHIGQQSLVYWRLGDVNLTTTPQKVIAMFLGTEGNTPSPGHVEARWEVPEWRENTVSISRLAPGKGKEKEIEEADPFADESIGSPMATSTPGNWVEIDGAAKLVSGKYEAI